jgi:hypothetical protein
MIDTVANAIMHWAVPYNYWDAISEDQRERWRNAARAAIAAMREPTAAMVETTWNMEGRPVALIWQSMVDEALTPADG